jgi:hypothetical protein
MLNRNINTIFVIPFQQIFKLFVLEEYLYLYGCSSFYIYNYE